MKTISTILETMEQIGELKSQGLKIGFVPTMGALHQGHLSLVRLAKKHADIVAVSIFVNPTQFNNQNDFDKYPRTVEEDLMMLEKEHIDFVFAPCKNEMYPKKDTRVFNLSPLDSVMEGKHRPGHFNGVAQIVSKLFDVVKPDIAVFGKKDFQQMAIIRKIVKDYNYKIEIIEGDIIREPDGLAMSSRNKRLTKDQRKSAARISAVLFESQKKMAEMSIGDLTQWVETEINKDINLTVEYFEIVHAETLRKVDDWNENCSKVGCVAVFCGDVRLIDNIKYSL